MSCLEDDNPNIVFDNETILSEFLEDQDFINHEVIACAASDNTIGGLINVYFYPEEGAKDFRLYQSWADDENDYSSYQFTPITPEPFFQGALGVFKIRSTCKWVVVIYEREDKIEISTPIRLKVDTQPTVWSSELSINQDTSLMPVFSWDVRSEEDNAIFFEVLATETFELLSGTYTMENRFQYYNLGNVVLNVTRGTPPDLIKGETYIFTVMDVSLDNWVNEVIMSPFIAE